MLDCCTGLSYVGGMCICVLLSWFADNDPALNKFKVVELSLPGQTVAFMIAGSDLGLLELLSMAVLGMHNSVFKFIQRLEMFVRVILRDIDVGFTSTVSIVQFFHMERHVILRICEYSLLYRLW